MHPRVEDLRQEIYTTLRGRLSARNLSMRLGVSANQYHRWETGSVEPTWSDFLLLAGHRSLAIRECLQKWYRFCGELTDTAHLCRTLVHGAPPAHIAAQTGLSQARTVALLEGNGRLRLVDFLSLLLVFNGDGTDFLQDLFAPYQLPSLTERESSTDAALRVAEVFPFADAVRSIAADGCYQGGTQTLVDLAARQLALAPHQVAAALQEMIKCGLMHWDANQTRLKSRGITYNTAIRRAVSLKIRKYWLARLVKFLETNPEGLGENICAYFVTILNPENARKVETELRACFERIQAIAEGEQGPEGRLSVIHLIRSYPESFGGGK